MLVVVPVGIDLVLRRITANLIILFIKVVLVKVSKSKALNYILVMVFTLLMITEI